MHQLSISPETLDALKEAKVSSELSQSLTGVEKESLRVAPGGSLSQTRHPRQLGSALTHPWITTDYSEAMLELITPPTRSVVETLDFLKDIHLYVYEKLREEKEILWATSMPCVLAGATNIPIAEYGNSNQGEMKHLYRVGLGHRYGKVMQVISGVHFNFSFSSGFWERYARVLGQESADRAFVDDHYMGMIRNIQRYGWLVPYLFGASPAVCISFFGEHKPEDLEVFDEGTYYLPYATSLRMSDIGYQNQKEKSVGIKANYDSLESYINSLTHAITTPAEAWEEIGLRDDSGKYRQLNTNILQIENEYYSTVRPKQVLRDMEMPTVALDKRGIEYVELRSLDVNASDPLGVNESQLCFLHVFMLYCLLADSPSISKCERREIDNNLLVTAREGRDPACILECNHERIPLRDWGMKLLTAMREVAGLFQLADEKTIPAVNKQIEKMRDADRTPSARMLAEMRKEKESFYAYAQAKSLEHHLYFDEQSLSGESKAIYERETTDSIARQLEIEEGDQPPFDTFLADYFSQALNGSD